MFYFGAGERAQQLSMCGALAEYPSLIPSMQVGWLTTACNPRYRKTRHLWSFFETIVTCTLLPCSCNWDKNIKTCIHIWNELTKYQFSMRDFHVYLYFPALFSISLHGLSQWHLPSHPYYFFFQFVLVPLHPCLKVLLSNGPILSYPVFTHINYFLDTCIYQLEARILIWHVFFFWTPVTLIKMMLFRAIQFSSWMNKTLLLFNCITFS